MMRRGLSGGESGVCGAARGWVSLAVACVVCPPLLARWGGACGSTPEAPSVRIIRTAHLGSELEAGCDCICCSIGVKHSCCSIAGASSGHSASGTATRSNDSGVVLAGSRATLRWANANGALSHYGFDTFHTLAQNWSAGSREAAWAKGKGTLSCHRETGSLAGLSVPCLSLCSRLSRAGG